MDDLRLIMVEKEALMKKNIILEKDLMEKEEELVELGQIAQIYEELVKLFENIL